MNQTLQELAREIAMKNIKKFPPENEMQAAVLYENYPGSPGSDDDDDDDDDNNDDTQYDGDGGFRNRKNKTKNKKYTKKRTYKRPKKRASKKNKTRKMKKNYL